MNKYLYPIKNLNTKSYIKWWLYRYLSSKIAKYILSEILEGTSFTLEDSVDKPFNMFEIIGNTTQDGTPTPENPIPIKNTGDNVNLFDSNSPTTTRGGVTLYNNGDGSYTLNGTFTGTTAFQLTTSPITLQNGKTYTQSIKVVSGTFRGSVVPNFKNSNDEIQYNVFNNNSTTTTTDTMTLNSYDYVISNGTTVNCTFKVKLEQGSKATPYSPYGCGNVNEKVQNKDFLKIENITASTNTTVTNGVVKQTTADTSTTFSWKFNCYNDNTLVKQLERIYKNTTGILEKTFTKDSTFNNIIFGLNGSQRDTLAKINLSNLPDGDYVLSFNITNMTQGSISWEDIQVEQGSTATDYVSHEEQNISFPLAEGQKLMQGDYSDDDKKVHHVSGEMVFDGSNDENWIYNPAYAYFYIRISGFETVDLCNYYLKETGGSVTNNHFRLNPANGNFFIKDERFTSELSFKEWLATNNVIIQGKRAEETTEDFTEEQQTAWNQIKALKTYKGQTIIVGDANLKIQYWKEG